MIKILVADDHPIVRQGLKQILSEYPDMTVADEAGTGKEVLARVGKKGVFDIVLLDVYHARPERAGHP